MFKKLILLTFSLFLYANVTTIPATASNIKNLKIVDIRTKSEWITTGVIDKSILISFFDEQGSYDANKFLIEMRKYFKKGDKVAIICHSGNRTRSIAGFLSSQGYDVVNLGGGISLLLQSGYKLKQYQGK